ncbi:MAG TPA: type II secretion system secretin GspD, partial [Candidatus Hydrogenedentes bacterium]|nr:type II secretion system secretin GspD [Candidatus Hydrogenedentota bacterium]
MRTAVEGRRQSWRVWWILLGVVLVAGAWGMDASAQDEEFPPSADVVPPVEDAVPAENGAPQPDTPAPAPLEPGPQEPQEMVQEEEAPPPPPPPPPTPARTGSFSSPSSRPVVAPPARGRSFPRGASAPKPAGPAVPPPPERKEVPNDQKTGETPPENEMVNFDFRDAPLTDVIQAISKLTGRNFDVDPNIGASTVTLITHDRIPPEMAYEVLESVLSSRGFAMVESLDGHLIKIVPIQDAPGSAKPPLYIGDKQPPASYDKFSTHILTLQHADATEIQKVLQILGSRNAQIDVYAPTNTLIITDIADGIRRMFAFLEQADVPGFDTSMEIFTLEYTRAEVLMNQINQVLLGDGTQGQAGAARAPVTAPSPVRPPIRPTISGRPVSGGPSSQIIGSREEVLRMVPDERLNALIVVATEGMMEKVRDLVRRLDAPTPYEANNLHIYQLLNADAESVEQALQPLISGSAPRRQTTGGAAGGAGTATAGRSTSTASAGGGAISDVQPFEQKVQVTRYDRTNSLLIVASPQDYKLLESFIARLDVPQRQVGVDAVVMDVTISNDFGLEVNTSAVKGRDGDLFGVTDTSAIAELNTAIGAAQEIVGGRRAALTSAVLAQGVNGGLTAGVYDDLTLTIDGQRVKVPFVPVLMQAVEKLTDVEVLSQPSLVTLDNEEASIVVGQEVPFITATSSSRRNDGTVDVGVYGGYTRVERQEVGIKLKVTPQISEGDNVQIKTEIEISDTDAKQIGTVDILGPTTNKSVVTNKSLVKDGSTAVIAGLIRDSAKRDRTQPPVLGDIPLIGWIFGSQSSRREKRNMVVLITPHIVKESSDMERLTQDKMNKYYDAHVEELFKSGFFDKIFRKYTKRENYRPTLERAESMTGRRETPRFKRGD